MLEMEVDRHLLLAVTNHLVDLLQVIDEPQQYGDARGVRRAQREQLSDETAHLLVDEFPHGALDSDGVEQREQHVGIDHLAQGDERLAERGDRPRRRGRAIGCRSADDRVQHVVDGHATPGGEGRGRRGSEHARTHARGMAPRRTARRGSCDGSAAYSCPPPPPRTPISRYAVASASPASCRPGTLEGSPGTSYGTGAITCAHGSQQVVPSRSSARDGRRFIACVCGQPSPV